MDNFVKVAILLDLYPILPVFYAWAHRQIVTVASLGSVVGGLASATRHNSYVLRVISNGKIFKAAPESTTAGAVIVVALWVS